MSSLNSTKFLGLIVCIILNFTLINCQPNSKFSQKELNTAKKTVNKMLNAETFEDYLSCFSEMNKGVIEGIDGKIVLKKSWERQRSNLKKWGQRWKISDVKGEDQNTIVVETNNRWNSHEYLVYYLIKEDNKWVINEGAFVDKY